MQVPQAGTLAGLFFSTVPVRDYDEAKAWYLGKLAGSSKLPPLRRLIDNQQEFIAAFEEIISRPHEQEEVLREMTVRCLAV